VSVICAALLFYSGLYSQLNICYNLREELYLNNQSSVNYALANFNGIDNSVADNSGITSEFETKNFGVLTLLKVSSFTNNDTITSIHFAGQYDTDKTCVHLTDFSTPLSYFGKVILIGDMCIPFGNMQVSYAGNMANELISEGSNSMSGKKLPELNPLFKSVSAVNSLKSMYFSEIEKQGDSLYYNSFSAETVLIEAEDSSLEHKVVKGNIIIQSRDSIVVKNSVVLEDVILSAPKIIFEEGFSGNVQAFASKSIVIGKNVMLSYPSVLCVSNLSEEKSSIEVKEKSKIYGAIVLCGFQTKYMGNNSIVLSKETLLTGDIYCEGELVLSGKVYGSVYTNRFVTKTLSGAYGNVLSNIEINVGKRPRYFIGIPLFATIKNNYGTLKKVL
jgi:cytoskeletal protein CcmA (bactofilin family)